MDAHGWSMMVIYMKLWVQKDEKGRFQFSDVNDGYMIALSWDVLLSDGCYAEYDKKGCL